MEKYIRVSSTVEAEQYLDNTPALACKCKPWTSIYGPEPHVHTGDSVVLLHKFDWIVKERGHLLVLGPDSFEVLYRKVK